jgi:hypothetical protein
MNTIKESIEVGGRIMLVEPKQALLIRQAMKRRQEKNAQISRDLKGMLPKGFSNQTQSLTGSNYSRHDNVDTRVINKTRYVNGRMVKVLETRFPEHLKREWTV